MRLLRTLACLGPAALVAAGLAGAARAETTVAPGEDLQSAVDRTAEGDIVVLAPGTHQGPVRLSRRVTLQGEPGAEVVGSGRGSVVTVAAAGATVRGLTVRGSGRDLDEMDAGVFVERSATGAVVEGNRLEGNLYGIYLHGAANAVARGNVIVGIKEGRINDAGNGVSVWNAPGAKVLDNDISFGRDGIFVITSRQNEFNRNRFRDVRFAIHYMYTNDSQVVGNTSAGNAVGYAIMFSHGLTVRDNVSDGDRDHGFLFNYANGSQVVGNVVRGRLQPAARWALRGMRASETREHGLPAADEPAARSGAAKVAPEKCVFIYNANKNRFRDNWFEGCEIGVHFTAGSEGNEIVGNAFVRNRNQVKYVGTRYLDWSTGGRGNYWSDNPAFDLDGDGIADTAYRPNDLIDRVLWTAPQAKVLVNSPAVQVIRWAQAQFPALLPGGVVDSRPLMSPPRRPQDGARGRP